jgi:multidrug efflux pump
VRSTLVPALTVPVSVVGTFGLLYLLGFSINIFTLLALVLAIGIVVDDAIVVLENIYRHIEDGATPMEAAKRTMGEIAFAIVTITLSLVAVFLPLAFVGGITGKLLVEFAVALAGAVVISAFVALTLSPMVSARILKPVGEVRHGSLFFWFERLFDRITRGYERMLRWCLRHRPTVVLVALGSLGLSFYFFRMLDNEFLPEEDKGRFLAIAIAPEGSSPEYTDRMVRSMEKIAGENPAIRSYFTAVALPFNGPGNPAQGFMFARLQDGERPPVRDVVGGPAGIGARFFGEVEGAFAIPILPKAVDLGLSQPFELVLTGNDLGQLVEYQDQLANRLRGAGFLANVRGSVELTKPEFRVRIDRDRAAALGVAVADIARTLQVLFSGEDLAEIKRDGRQFDVIVQLERDQRVTPADLARLHVPAAGGRTVQLANVVTLSEGAGPNQIERFNRQRSTTIQATPAGVPLGTAMDRVEAMLAESLPQGMGYAWKGESLNLRESSGEIYFFLFLAIVVVYMVLAAQFESFVHPFTVMLALPLAGLGAFGLLYGLAWVDHFGNQFFGWANYAPDPPEIARTLSKIVPRIPSMNLNIFSQVGLVILVGLVTKNSILLVEFANQRMARGLDAAHAMLEAGKIRLRPILMTSLATIAGILPIAIGFGEAAEGRRPLGVVAVGGMVTSTLLTLFVIPVIYTIFARCKKPEKAPEPATAPSPAADA